MIHRSSPLASAPATVRRSLDATAAALMTVFCVGLGLQQVAIKVIADDVSPIAQIAIRSALAALMVLAVARAQKVRLLAPGQLLPSMAVGLGFTLEFTFVAVGLNYALASHMAVFLYTSPVFAAFGLHALVPGEQLVRRQWIGVLLAFAGLVVAMAPSPGVSSAILIGDAFGVLAGLSWALTTLAVRTSTLSEAPPVRTLAYQLITAGALLLTAAALAGDLGTIRMSGLVWASMTFQTLVVAFGALLIWFWLLRRYLASRLGVFAFVSPILGVAFGAVLLDKPLSP